MNEKPNAKTVGNMPVPFAADLNRASPRHGETVSSVNFQSSTSPLFAFICAILVSTAFAAVFDPTQLAKDFSHWGRSTSCGLVIYIVVVCWTSRTIFRRKPWKSFVTLTPEGLVYPRFSTDIIPWDGIDELRLRTVGKGRSARCFLDILLGDNVASHIRRNATTDSALFTHLPGRPHLCIEVGRIKNRSALEATGIIGRYRRQYGTSGRHGHTACSVVDFLTRQSVLF